MKIVISESQYHSLFESQNEKNSNLIYKMWNDGMDIYEISELLGMKETQVVVLLKDKEINIDCGFADNLLPILYKTNLLNTKFNFNGGQMKIELEWSNFGEYLEFEYEDKDCRLVGMSTPYWNGDCTTPVDGSEFENKITGDYVDSYDKLGLRIDSPSNFKSIQELMDFLNNYFPKKLIVPIRTLIDYYK